MRTALTNGLGSASRLAALAALLAALLPACSTAPTVPGAGKSADPATTAQAGHDPCQGRDPATEASATQGISAANPHNPYTGKDVYANVVVKEGTVFYSLTPGAPPRFAVTEQTLRDAGGSWERYYALVQVTTDPGTDPDGKPRRLREMVRAFHVTEALCAAHGIAMANPQFGSGGGAQYYVSPADTAKLRPGENVPISRWRLAEGSTQ
jgi:hypothetical protein